MADLLVIDRATVRRLLPYDLCTPLMRDAMIALSSGRTQQLLRQIIDLGEGRAFGVMPGATADAIGAKLISVYPGSVAAGGQSHRGILALFDPHSGAPVAIVHAGEVTAIRTAAASAAATQALARPEARRLAILGAGEQAAAHAEAIAGTRPLAEIRLWARALPKARLLAAHLASTLGVPVTPFAEAEDAVRDAEIICTVSAASEPILRSAWVADGAHVNVVGSSRAGPREIDDALVVRARIIADHRQGVLLQGAEFLHAKAGALVDDDHIRAEIGDVMSGAAVGRTSPDEVTIYKSLGAIVQDLACGWLVYSRARQHGLGAANSF